MTSLTNVHKSGHGKNVRRFFKCPFCFINCVDAESLIEHLRSHNWVTKPENKSNQTSLNEASLPPCQVRLTRCDSIIASQRLNDHWSIVKPSVKLPENGECEREKQANNYIEKITKEGKLLYGCPVCFKESHSRSHFERHFRTHSGERPYVCKHCNRAFSIHCNLKVHIIRKHTGERSFKCVHCDRSFSTSNQLKSHTRVHSGLKPYTCKHCNRAFSQFSSLKVHIQCKHGVEKPFKCEFCQYKCAVKSNLKRHYHNFHKLVNWNPSTK